MDHYKVALVGAKGYIGRNSIFSLQRSGIEVAPIYSESRNELLDSSFWRNSNFNSVIWLASSINPQSAKENPKIVSEEISYFSSVCEAISESETRIIFASSGGTVYSGVELPFTEDSPASGVNEYGKAKVTQENLLRDSGAKFTILRLANVYGRDQVLNNGQGVIAAWLGQVQKNMAITVFGSTELIRDFVHIDDVSSAIVQVVNKQHNNEVFNIGSGVGTQLSQVISLIGEISDTEPVIENFDSRLFDRPEVWLDISKASSFLDWAPVVNLRDGIDATWQGMNSMVTE